MKRGRIDHALRFTVSRSRRAYVYPARHFASDLTDPALPPMGLRLRLKTSFDTRPFPRQARIVLEALKRYGMIVSDNGSDWYVSGAPDPRWSNDQLHTLHRVTGSAFEVVDTSSLRVRSAFSAGPSAWPPRSTGSYRSPWPFDPLERLAHPEVARPHLRVSSSQRSGVETGAPGFGRTE